MSNCIDPILCILPPHMLQNIAQNGTERQREAAMGNLTASARMRGQRQMITEFMALAQATPAAGKERVIYDAENGSSLPGQQVRAEGEDPTGDPAVDEAYDGAGATYDLYKEAYNRDSIDNRGMRLDSTVHYRTGYDNAFWNGRQMVYGDGDEDLPEAERLFNRFTIAIDIIGHELTHGVTQFEAGLVYRNQPGALNESFSDVFGSLVKQQVRGQTAREADWIIGEGLFTSNVNGVGIRSMKAPGTAYDDPILGSDPQPGHMDDYKDVSYDNGGVHINSGIPNRAFYVASYEMDGFAWEKMGLVWYVTLTERLGSTANFQAAASTTFEVAGERFGVNSLEQQAVRKGWAEVGIDVAGEPDGEEPGGCLEALMSALGMGSR